jgi:hypothetical protein
MMAVDAPENAVKTIAVTAPVEEITEFGLSTTSVVLEPVTAIACDVVPVTSPRTIIAPLADVEMAAAVPAPPETFPFTTSEKFDPEQTTP